jgi:hypothetical protein
MSTCRIGVTGHRDYDDPVGTQVKVDTALTQAVGGAEVVDCWTSLAEGADRLVAERVAVAHPHARLHVVLPLDAADYCNDFASPASVAEFHRLLAGAASVSVVGPDAGGTRESAYERAGLAVIDEVHTLIAVWDGQPARGRGGTAHIVEHAKELGRHVVVVPVTRS